MRQRWQCSLAPLDPGVVAPTARPLDDRATGVDGVDEDAEFAGRESSRCPQAASGIQQVHPRSKLAGGQQLNEPVTFIAYSVGILAFVWLT